MTALIELPCQADYEQELAIQKAAHRRELARSKDEMQQLLASAESQTLRIDEDTIRKKYNKDIDRIKVIKKVLFSYVKSNFHREFCALSKLNAFVPPSHHGILFLVVTYKSVNIGCTCT